MLGLVMLSDALKGYGAGEKDISADDLKMIAYACIGERHAGMCVYCLYETAEEQATDG